MIKPILLLGDPTLYEVSSPITMDELPEMLKVASHLHDTLMAYRATYGAGRAIAAPQIGILKRLIYMHIDKPLIMINPSLTFPTDERMEVLDDCMSFPKLYVKVDRYLKLQLNYTDENWQSQSLQLEGDLSELIQHEYDHLDGILATMRAKDARAFVMKP